MKTKAKILVVDDEEAVGKMLEKFLTKEGYEVSIALNGKEAIKEVEKEQPQIVFLDIRLPGEDGISVLKTIKKIDKKICVIMITAIKDDEIGKKCLDLGASDYITKPLSLEYLEDILRVKLLNCAGQFFK